MMAAETFVRLFFGFLFQVVPFGILALYPFRDRLRVSKKTALALVVCAIPGVGAVFAGVGCGLQGMLPGDATLFNAVNAVFLVCLLPCLALYLVLVRAVWQEKLFVFAFALTCAWGITATADIVFTVVHRDGPFDGLPYQSWTPLLLLGLGVVFVPLLMLLLKKSYLPVRDGISWKQSTVLALLAVLMFVMLASIFVITAFTDAANPLTMALFLIVLVMVFMVYAALLGLLRVGNELLEAQRVADRAEHTYRLQAQQISSMNEAKQHDRRMRHDVRHALVTLRGLVARGDRSAALDLIDGYVDGIGNDSITRFCGNEAVNSVLSYYAAAAKKNEVCFKAKVSLGNSVKVRDAELCVILGNLLDNALAAASRGDEGSRWMQVGIATSGDAVAIIVDNGFDGYLRKEGTRYLSTKQGHAALGIESVRVIAARHCGGAEFSHEDKVFHAAVMLGGVLLDDLGDGFLPRTC